MTKNKPRDFSPDQEVQPELRSLAETLASADVAYKTVSQRGRRGCGRT